MRKRVTLRNLMRMEFPLKTLNFSSIWSWAQSKLCQKSQKEKRWKQHEEIFPNSPVRVESQLETKHHWRKSLSAFFCPVTALIFEHNCTFKLQVLQSLEGSVLEQQNCHLYIRSAAQDQSGFSVTDTRSRVTFHQWSDWWPDIKLCLIPHCKKRYTITTQ